MRALLLLEEADKVGEAYIVWQDMVESQTFESMPVLQQAIYNNNYAWATLMHRPAADSLLMARRYAEKAYQMAPWISAIKGALAAVMVAQGEYQEGAAWALSVARETEKERSPSRNEDVATSLATAALGYFYLGEHEKANDLLRQATALALNDLAVQKVIAEMRENMPAIEVEMASPLAFS